jgi:hypothetical protein
VLVLVAVVLVVCIFFFFKKRIQIPVFYSITCEHVCGVINAHIMYVRYVGTAAWLAL